MAAGDTTLFDQFYFDLGAEIHDLDNDTIKGAFITSGVTPAAGNSTPRWAASSGIDYDGNECATGTSYSAGGVDLSAGWALTSSKGVLTTAGFTLSQDAAAGFENARWMIIYNDTATNKNAIGFLDLGSARSIKNGDLQITYSSGILDVGA